MQMQCDNLLSLEQLEHPTDEAQRLVSDLETELAGQFESHQRHGLSLDRLFRPNIRFFLARLNKEAIGCGGIAFEDGFAEVKRMYVRPTVRGKGVAQAILAHLEVEARQRGYSRLLLETGDVLSAAIRLYERAGFKRCDAFGAYVKLPPRSIERSFFFEKSITAQPGAAP